MNTIATKAERKKYVLTTEQDYEILEKCKTLKKQKLSKADKETVKLIETQLKREWRKALIKKLNQILKKHKQ